MKQILDCFTINVLIRKKREEKEYLKKWVVRKKTLFSARTNFLFFRNLTQTTN